MGDLIVMTRPTGPSRRASASDASAEILFFTGVRYQRMPDVQVAEDVVTVTARRRSEKARKAAAARRLKRLA